MSKQKTWKGHPLYESPDGRVVTIDKATYDAYMRTQDDAKARDKRRGKLAKVAATQPTQAEIVGTDAVDAPTDTKKSSSKAG